MDPNHVLEVWKHCEGCPKVCSTTMFALSGARSVLVRCHVLALVLELLVLPLHPRGAELPLELGRPRELGVLRLLLLGLLRLAVDVALPAATSWIALAATSIKHEVDRSEILVVLGVLLEELPAHAIGHSLHLAQLRAATTMERVRCVHELLGEELPLQVLADGVDVTVERLDETVHLRSAHV